MRWARGTYLIGALNWMATPDQAVAVAGFIAGDPYPVTAGESVTIEYDPTGRVLDGARPTPSRSVIIQVVTDGGTFTGGGGHVERLGGQGAGLSLAAHHPRLVTLEVTESSSRNGAKGRTETHH